MWRIFLWKSHPTLWCWTLHQCQRRTWAHSSSDARRCSFPSLPLCPKSTAHCLTPHCRWRTSCSVPLETRSCGPGCARILWKTGSWDSGQVIRIGDLVIDQERYEIAVAGRRVILTFKEYQLLCLLATNPGRVYSREALLSRVWGLRLLWRHPHRGRPHPAAEEQGGGCNPPVHRDGAQCGIPLPRGVTRTSILTSPLLSARVARPINSSI